MAGKDNPEPVAPVIGEMAPRTKQRTRYPEPSRNVPRLRGRETEPRTIGAPRPRAPQGKQRPGRGYREQDISQSCMFCGKIYRGPNTGDTVPADRKVDPRTGAVMHKGHPVGHGGSCPDCGPKWEEQMREESRQRVRERYPNMGRMAESEGQ